MTQASGIYKLTHIPTNKFYIGGTRNLHKRFATHKSHFKHGTNHKQIQDLYDITKDINDWKIEMVKTCMVRNLNRLETQYLKQCIIDPNCLNVRKEATGGRRNLKTNKEGRERLAVSLLGKNTTEGILRPNNLTFISPSGKEYQNVISVNRFAKDHNLYQVGMNALANGKLASYAGWTRKNSILPTAANVIEYWSRERMLQHYPEYSIIGPDGTEYKTFVLYHFELEHNCKVITTAFQTTAGVKSSTRGLDKYGRGYRLSNVPYYTVEYEGKTYDNVISLGKFAEGIGMTKKEFNYHMTANRLHIKKYKKTKRFTYNLVTPN